MCSRRGTWRHPVSFGAASVALGGIQSHLAWHPWHLCTHNLPTHNLPTHNLVTHNLLTHTTCPRTTCPHTTFSHTTLATQTFTFCGRRRRGTYGTGLALAARLGPICRRWTPQQFVWQAWHLVTSSLIWRGRRGNW